MNTDIKPIAIYLPQFHPTPENDAWWGKGFTEWTNVTKALPRFDGHYQPHLPADMGFYDLRLEEARLEQEKLAKEYGIFGFCYYHYWFNGKRMLYEPLDRKLENPKEDLPFMLCWANENWTRAWDGLDREMLMEQTYSDADNKAHMEMLCAKYFTDSRYIRHEGKPVFLVYRPKLFTDIKQTLQLWRTVARESGIGELHIGYTQSWGLMTSPEEMGFDFAVGFQPNFANMPDPKPKTITQRIVARIKRDLGIKTPEKTAPDRIIDYGDFVEKQQQMVYVDNVSPSITPMWDNSPRRKTNAIIFKNGTPEKYESWLMHILENFPWKRNKEKFLFINAWNEWAEGNHLEPCQKWGRAYLEKTKRALQNNKTA